MPSRPGFTLIELLVVIAISQSCQATLRPGGGRAGMAGIAPAEASDTLLRVVTYNLHGGVGPNGGGNLSANLPAFKAMLQGDGVVCLQEVPVGSGWTTVQTIFSDYPYAFTTDNTTTARYDIWVRSIGSHGGTTTTPSCRNSPSSALTAN